MKFNQARKIAWAMLMLSPFLRREERQHREQRLLASHTRCTLKGASKRWGFADGSVLELMGGKYRVIK